MEITTLAQIINFRTKFETIFNTAFKTADSNIDKWAFVFNSGRVEQVVHRWMQGLQLPREFIGDRFIQNLNTNGFSVLNKEWEDTLGIPRRDIERDQFGIYEPMMSEMAATAKIHRDSLGANKLSTALATPASALAYDGQNFFGTHDTTTGRAVAFTNLTNVRLNEPSLSAAITSIRNRRNFTGLPFRGAQGALKLLIHPSNELTAAKLANQAYFPTTQPGSGASSAASQAAAGENILKGMFTYEIEEFLLTPDEWYLYLDHPIYRPIIFQLEQEVELMAPPQFFNAEWSSKDQFVFGTRAFYAAAVALPESVYGSTGTV